MKRILICITGLFFCGSALAQIPEDALRMSWLQPNGTARNQAIGGASGSLGGDISATFVNPAGLGVYKTSELVISPGFSFLNNKSNFRETSASAKNSSFNFGTSGLVLGFGNGRGNFKGTAISFAVNRTANFNNSIYYKGENNYSSYSEPFAIELAESGIEIDDALNSDYLSLGTRMAVYSYLVDTATVNGSIQVVGLPEFIENRMQENTINTKGGITELAFGAAGNINDKFYFGGSLGLPIVNYEKTTIFRETDATGNTNNDFNFSELTENYSTKGVGLNARLGLIFKPAGSVRLGLALHTPTVYGLKDTYYADMTTDTENYPASPGVVSVRSEEFTNNIPSQFRYDLISPWKVLVSGSYIFHEVEDVTKQRGFVSADVEYINYKASSFQSAETNSDNSYYNGVNNTIDDIYKSSINVRVGGELKFNTFMARAGYAYYGNPNKEKEELKTNRMFISGGLGYRNKGIFLDLTYVHRVQNDVNFPYRLTDKANTFAGVKGNGGNIVLTAGLKF